MRRHLIALLATLVGLCGSTRIEAQNARAVDAAVESLSSKANSLSTTNQNLVEMLASLDDRDRAQVDLFLTNMSDTNGYINTLLMVAYIYPQMVDQRDATTVRRYLSLACGALSKSADRTSASGNKILPKLSSSALIQEVTKGRDLVVQLGQSDLCRIVPPHQR